MFEFNFNLIKFAKLISKLSKTQVIIIKNYNEPVKYFKKNLMNNEIIIGMGAGSISKWMIKKESLSTENYLADLVRKVIADQGSKEKIIFHFSSNFEPWVDSIRCSKS